jgi:hypothetical protein
MGDVCETRVSRKIFGLEGEEVKGSWRKLRNEPLEFTFDVLLG